LAHFFNLQAKQELRNTALLFVALLLYVLMGGAVLHFFEYDFEQKTYASWQRAIAP